MTVTRFKIFFRIQIYNFSSILLLWVFIYCIDRNLAFWALTNARDVVSLILSFKTGFWLLNCSRRFKKVIFGVKWNALRKFFPFIILWFQIFIENTIWLSKGFVRSNISFVVYRILIECRINTLPKVLHLIELNFKRVGHPHIFAVVGKCGDSVLITTVIVELIDCKLTDIFFLRETNYIEFLWTLCVWAVFCIQILTANVVSGLLKFI